ncbi:MAG: 50S ribosomal protein L21 [Chloroflexi bacterium]|nr:MAG: 50S ribosomal protein L21 [Chloroflexota bacterium]
MYAVIETGSKQYRVAEGDVIEVETLPAEPGDRVELDKVLLVSGEKGVVVGNPTVQGAKVVATVQTHGRGKKVIVYKHKKNYHKKQGHRQNFTRLHIDEISVEEK